MLLGIAALAVGATAVVLLARGGSSSRSAAPVDAAPPPVDAATLDAAPPVDAAAPDAALPVDAREPIAPSPRDAREPSSRDAGSATAPAARGELRVGADPWGEVLLDGKPLGRAPGHWQVPAGPHRVDVVFPGDDGEVRRHFDLDVPAGGRASVFADFTGS